jgi:hypothetical protein
MIGSAGGGTGGGRLMMRYDLRPLIPLFLAAGCVTEKAYTEEAADLQCQIEQVCSPEGYCPTASELESGDCQKIDREMAAQCLSDLEEIRDELDAAGDEAEEEQLCMNRWPESCASVYVARKSPKCNTQSMDVPGRPLIADGVFVVAPVVVGNAWAELATSSCARSAPAAAAAWLEAARFEHASIAAFARISMELMALGAPPSLIARAHRAALDEIEHAKLCLRLARSLSGAGHDLGALPVAPFRKPDLATVAIEALLEGCVGEGAASVIAQMGSTRADERFAAVQSAIAADELVHAQLGWATVGWALSQDPALASPLLAALGEHRAQLRARPLVKDEEGLAEFGLVSAHERRSAHFALIDEVVRPTLVRLIERHTAGETRRARAAQNQVT